jgi:hypothetical protein
VEHTSNLACGNHAWCLNLCKTHHLVLGVHDVQDAVNWVDDLRHQNLDSISFQSRFTWCMSDVHHQHFWISPFLAWFERLFRLIHVCYLVKPIYMHFNFHCGLCHARIGPTSMVGITLCCYMIFTLKMRQGLAPPCNSYIVMLQLYTWMVHELSRWVRFYHQLSMRIQERLSILSV